MNLPRYRIAPSRIVGAAQSLSLEQPIGSDNRITAPAGIGCVYKWTDLRKLADPRALLPASRDGSLEPGS